MRFFRRTVLLYFSVLAACVLLLPVSSASCFRPLHALFLSSADVLPSSAASPSSFSSADKDLLLPFGVSTNAAGEALLPVLCVETRSGSLPGDEAEAGVLTVLEASEDGALRRILKTQIEIRQRGSTSRRFPKKSYRIKLVSASGKKQDCSIAGLREDDDWILNPMYSDTSKIREALCFWLWNEINSQGQAAQSSRFRFAEVWLNGEYWGLYGLQERVDRKQVNADRQTGILYKADANDRPSAAELRACTEDERCRGLQLVYAGEAVSSPWLPAADYLAMLESASPPGPTVLSPENTVDYALWAALVQARDGHFKNQFLHARLQDNGYVLYRIPWDLNHTLGDLWNGSSPETNYLDYRVTRLALDDAAEKYLEAADPAFRSGLQSRWEELRSGILAGDIVLRRARALFSSLYPAILRDSERWPACGMGEGSAANIRDIEDYFQVILPRMDGWILSLTSTGQETEMNNDGNDLDRGR